MLVYILFQLIFLTFQSGREAYPVRGGGTERVQSDNRRHHVGFLREEPSQRLPRRQGDNKLDPLIFKMGDTRSSVSMYLLMGWGGAATQG